jgi:hypothetical protein
MVAQDVIQKTIIKINWDKKRKIFTRGFDNTVVLNMASTAIRAIIYFDELKGYGGKLIKKYCIPAADKIISYQMENGCFPYTSKKNDDKAPLIYVAITLQGLISLYKRTNKKKYFESCLKAAEFLVKNIDKETNLFFHRFERGGIIKYPEFVAGSAIIIHQLKRLEELGYKFKDENKLLKALEKNQYKTGGIKQFVGFSDIFMPLFYPPEPEKNKWRDLLPIPGWNALAFDALTYCFNGNFIPKPKNQFPGIYNSEKFKIIENKKTVEFIKNNEIFAKWTKINHVWDFGKIDQRPGDQRIKHQLYVWKKRLWFLKPFLNLMYPFKISKPKR